MSAPLTLAGARALLPGAWVALTHYAARKLATEASVRVPRPGYEVKLCDDWPSPHPLGGRSSLYLVNRLHPQFGSFGLTGTHTFEVRRY